MSSQFPLQPMPYSFIASLVYVAQLRLKQGPAASFLQNPPKPELWPEQNQDRFHRDSRSCPAASSKQPSRADPEPAMTLSTLRPDSPASGSYLNAAKELRESAADATGLGSPKEGPSPRSMAHDRGRTGPPTGLLRRAAVLARTTGNSCPESAREPKTFAQLAEQPFNMTRARRSGRRVGIGD
jgi:hypothetical protein